MAEILNGKKKDLGGFSVTRIVPNTKKRMVGPFVFIDHMGPVKFAPGDGIDVRPHPHIGLATVTYMLEGSLVHRDSLGNSVEIVPGDVNWMTAGRGIVHSERETHEAKATETVLNGMQCWVALPENKAEIDPGFMQVKKCQLPHRMLEGVHMRLIAGEAYGMTSPIKTYSPMFYLDVLASKGSSFQRPDSSQECAVYIVNGDVEIEGNNYSQGQFVLLGQEREVRALKNSRCLLFGGDHWPEVPQLYWNFVSFSKERLEQAKADWAEGRFPQIPGDHLESIPLPD